MIYQNKNKSINVFVIYEDRFIFGDIDGNIFILLGDFTLHARKKIHKGNFIYQPIYEEVQFKMLFCAILYSFSDVLFFLLLMQNLLLTYNNE